VRAWGGVCRPGAGIEGVGDTPPQPVTHNTPKHPPHPQARASVGTLPRARPTCCSQPGQQWLRGWSSSRMQQQRSSDGCWRGASDRSSGSNGSSSSSSRCRAAWAPVAAQRTRPCSKHTQ
jgi:hypothetical protein